jgi:hypothetical protein
MSRRRFLLCCAALGLAAEARAHDASAYGGLFRSRDFGANWFPADAGLYVGGAFDLAIDAKDPNQLLYATDSRLLRSANGGRDWRAESLPPGAVYGAALGAGGEVAFAITSQGVHISRAGVWRVLEIDAAALPVRGLFSHAGSDWVLATDGLYRASADGVRRIAVPALTGAPQLVAATTNELLVLFASGMGISHDNGASWSHMAAPGDRVPSFVAATAGGFWCAVENRLFRRDGGANRWLPFGLPLPDPAIVVRGLAVDRALRRVVVASFRGLHRSEDGGTTWTLLEGNLPVHLEAGFLRADPHDGETLYAGFSLLPYSELGRRAGQTQASVAPITPLSLAGAGAFLILLGAGAVFAVRWLRQPRVSYRPLASKHD